MCRYMSVYVDIVIVQIDKLRCDSTDGDASAQKPAQKLAQKPAQYMQVFLAKIQEDSDT
jgi:hypothetical protein